MSLTAPERKLLEDARDEAARAHTEASKARVASEYASSQITELFTRVNEHDRIITTVKTRQDDCNAAAAWKGGMMSGNLSEQSAARSAQVGLWLTIAAVFFSVFVSPIVAAMVTRAIVRDADNSRPIEKRHADDR